MAHGTRGRWMRVAATGFGVLLCTSLVGCMNDKKDGKFVGKQPTPGLPGTTMLPGGNANAKNGVPANQYGTPGGIQQTGGVSQNRSGNNNWGQPAAPGAPGAIGAPAQPGFVPSPLPNASNFQPAGGVDPRLGGTNTTAPHNTVAGGGPLTPSLTDTILPPPPPGHVTASGSEFAAGGVQPPPATLPLSPIPPAPPFGKGN